VTTAAAAVLLAAAGAAAGPHARAVIFRLGGPPDAAPRQACPGCGAALLGGKPWPVGVLAPAGRCRWCETRIGPWLGAVEATGAAVLGLAAARGSPALVLAATVWLGLCAVPLVWIDWADHRLPDPLTMAACAGTAALLTAAAATGGQWAALARALLGGAALAGLYLVLALVGVAGLGDFKLAASLGTALAWSGWGTLATGAVAGFVLAMPYAAGLLAMGRAGRGDRIAFGPWMVAGAFLVIAIAGLAGPA
jgi:leader peptidase (prepilin peptidase)/N-methyltransferase